MFKKVPACLVLYLTNQLQLAVCLGLKFLNFKFDLSIEGGGHVGFAYLELLSTIRRPKTAMTRCVQRLQASSISLPRTRTDMGTSAAAGEQYHRKTHFQRLGQTWEHGNYVMTHIWKGSLIGRKTSISIFE